MPQKKITYRLMSSADDEKEFYAVMGKFFASAKVRRDFHGYPLNNDDARQWIVAFDGENVIGFGSFGVDKNEIGHLYDAWVHPDFRKRGIHTHMLNLRMQWFLNHNIESVKVIAYPSTEKLFKKLGFCIERMRGQYAYMCGAPILCEEVQ